MARTTISIPDELHAEVKRAGINVSEVTREALELELAARRSGRLQEVLTDPERVAQRLRATRQPQDDEHLGYELGVAWAAAEATIAELEEVVSADIDTPLDVTDPAVAAENSLVAFIEGQTDWKVPIDDYSEKGGPVLVDLSEGELLRGFYKGAKAVLQRVSPLVRPPLPSVFPPAPVARDDFGPDEAPF